MAFNLGFNPQSASGQHLFVSCGRQNPSGAAPIAEQLSRQMPVWYDNGTAASDGGQDEVTQQLAGSCAVVFFADSNLFAGEDTDVCNEMALAKIYSKPTVCVWCENMSNFDVRRLSDSMYNLWLDFKNMSAVNAYEKGSAADAAAAIVSATGGTAVNQAAAADPFDDNDFPDITAASALGAAAPEFNAFGTDSFAETAANTVNTAPLFAPVPPQTAAVNYPTAQAPAPAAYPAQTEPQRKRRPLLVVVIILAILVILCLLLFTMCSKVTGMGLIPDFTGGTGSNVESESDAPRVKPTYVAEIQSADDMEVNDDIKFGTFDNEEIEWVVLDRDGDNLLLITKNVLTQKPFDDTYIPSNFTQKQLEKLDEEHTTRIQLSQNSFIEKLEYGVNWENCSLRQWLNSEFINTAFTADEQDKINKTFIYTPDVEVEPEIDNLQMLSSYTMSCGDDTVDKVFLLSAEECDTYFPTLTDRSTDKSWWMRSNGYGYGHMDVTINGVEQKSDYLHDEQIQIVDESGHPFKITGQNIVNDSRKGTYDYYYVGDHVFNEGGVRPAIWVNVG